MIEMLNTMPYGILTGPVTDFVLSMLCQKNEKIRYSFSIIRVLVLNEIQQPHGPGSNKQGYHFFIFL